MKRFFIGLVVTLFSVVVQADNGFRLFDDVPMPTPDRVAGVRNVLIFRQKHDAGSTQPVYVYRSARLVGPLTAGGYVEVAACAKGAGKFELGYLGASGARGATERVSVDIPEAVGVYFVEVSIMTSDVLRFGVSTTPPADSIRQELRLQRHAKSRANQASDAECGAPVGN